MSDELAPGATAGDYVVEATLARGGSGTVYRATHAVLGRRAAIKVLHADLAASREMVERFFNEARAANRIRHPAIVDIYDLGLLSDGRPYLVMELIDGVGLDALVRARGRLAAAEVLELVEPLAAALAAAHAAGIVHRDLKASNVLVVDGAPRTVVLCDFGIAKLLAPEPGAAQLTSVGRRLGTPYAMPPEQVRGLPVDQRADIYALGVLLFQLLTGRHPFEADDPLEVERMHLEAPPPRPSSLAPVPPALDAVVLRCLEKPPERRYPDVGAVVEALRAALGRREGGAGPRPAIGIHVEARLDDAGDELDDDLLDAAAAVVEAAEQALRAAGLAVPLCTASAVLGVLLLPEGAAADAERRRAFAIALALRDSLRALAGAGVSVTLHCDKVIARGAEVVGGPLLRIGAWAAAGAGDGVFATAAALAGLAGLGPPAITVLS